ncbi:hypothetical protein FRC08_004269 [Ceratobasidium sp. 394]|nr:hypothetical protein FRC08_004269 [Ceratobasidium sp. 394]KAG9100590.1 hypothetical protein FS749_014343 [Ceratobasidium sp. UAMH 11750]
MSDPPEYPRASGKPAAPMPEWIPRDPPLPPLPIREPPFDLSLRTPHELSASLHANRPHTSGGQFEHERVPSVTAETDAYGVPPLHSHSNENRPLNPHFMDFPPGHFRSTTEPRVDQTPFSSAGAQPTLPPLSALSFSPNLAPPHLDACYDTITPTAASGGFARPSLPALAQSANPRPQLTATPLPAQDTVAPSYPTTPLARNTPLAPSTHEQAPSVASYHSSPPVSLGSRAPHPPALARSSTSAASTELVLTPNTSHSNPMGQQWPMVHTSHRNSSSASASGHIQGTQPRPRPLPKPKPLPQAHAPPVPPHPGQATAVGSGGEPATPGVGVAKPVNRQAPPAKAPAANVLSTSALHKGGPYLTPDEIDVLFAKKRQGAYYMAEFGIVIEKFCQPFKSDPELAKTACGANPPVTATFALVAQREFRGSRSAQSVCNLLGRAKKIVTQIAKFSEHYSIDCNSSQEEEVLKRIAADLKDARENRDMVDLEYLDPYTVVCFTRNNWYYQLKSCMDTQPSQRTTTSKRSGLITPPTGTAMQSEPSLPPLPPSVSLPIPSNNSVSSANQNATVAPLLPPAQEPQGNVNITSQLPSALASLAPSVGGDAVSNASGSRNPSASSLRVPRSVTSVRSSRQASSLGSAAGARPSRIGPTPRASPLASAPAPAPAPVPALAPAPVPAPRPALPTTRTLSDDGDEPVGDLLTTHTFSPPGGEASLRANEEARDWAAFHKRSLQFRERQMDYEHRGQEIRLGLLKREADGNERERNQRMAIARAEHQANQRKRTQRMEHDHEQSKVNTVTAQVKLIQSEWAAQHDRLINTANFFASTLGSDHPDFKKVSQQLVTSSLNQPSINIPAMVHQALTSNNPSSTLASNQLVVSGHNLGLPEAGPSNHPNRLDLENPGSIGYGDGRFEDMGTVAGSPPREMAVDTSNEGQGEGNSEGMNLEEEEDDLYTNY